MKITPHIYEEWKASRRPVWHELAVALVIVPAVCAGFVYLVLGAI